MFDSKYCLARAKANGAVAGFDEAGHDFITGVSDSATAWSRKERRGTVPSDDRPPGYSVQGARIGGVSNESACESSRNFSACGSHFSWRPVSMAMLFR